MSFNRRKHEGKKPWEVEPFNRLTAVQIYKSGALCEGCQKSPSKFLYATPDNQALDLCFACTEDAFVAGAIANRWHIENYDAINKSRKWIDSRSLWPLLREPKDGIAYNPAA